MKRVERIIAAIMSNLVIWTIRMVVDFWSQPVLCVGTSLSLYIEQYAVDSVDGFHSTE